MLRHSASPLCLKRHLDEFRYSKLEVVKFCPAQIKSGYGASAPNLSENKNVKKKI
jgi:hypothetical protein